MRTQSWMRRSLALLLMVLVCLPFAPGCGGQDESGVAADPNIGPGGPPGAPEGKGDPKSSHSGGGKDQAGAAKSK